MAICRRMSLGAAALPLLLAVAALLSPMAQARRLVLQTGGTNPDANKRWGAKASCSTTIANCATCDSTGKCTACCNTQLCGSSSYNYYLTSFGACSLMMNFDNLPVPQDGYSSNIPNGLRGFNFIGDATVTTLIPKIRAITGSSLKFIGRTNWDKVIASQPLGLYTIFHAENEWGSNIVPHLFAMVPSISGARFDLLSFKVTAVASNTNIVSGKLRITGSSSTRAGAATPTITLDKSVTLSTAGPTSVTFGTSGRNLLWVDFDFIADANDSGGDPEMIIDDIAFVPR